MELYFSIVFNCIVFQKSWLKWASVFLNCISELYFLIKMCKGGAGGAERQLFSIVLLNCISQLYSMNCISDNLIKMSKGGAGGAAANVLLLKKNEDKWERCHFLLWQFSWERLHTLVDFGHFCFLLFRRMMRIHGDFNNKDDGDGKLEGANKNLQSKHRQYVIATTAQCFT